MAVQWSVLPRLEDQPVSKKVPVPSKKHRISAVFVVDVWVVLSQGPSYNPCWWQHFVLRCPLRTNPLNRLPNALKRQLT